MKIYSRPPYNLRQLTVVDWQNYKQIRLAALVVEPGVFGANFDSEAQYEASHWQAMLSDLSRAYFGLFHDDALVGMTGVIADKYQANRCVLIASFIIPEHRGRKHSELFYEARLDWARQQGYKQAIVSHRISNAASKAANQRAGFTYAFTKAETWPDGVVADKLFYVRDL